MSPPKFDRNPEKFSETESMRDSWIFYQLIGCPDAFVDRAKRDLLFQRCIPSLREPLEVMLSDHPTMSSSDVNACLCTLKHFPKMQCFFSCRF